MNKREQVEQAVFITCGGKSFEEWETTSRGLVLLASMLLEQLYAERRANQLFTPYSVR